MKRVILNKVILKIMTRNKDMTQINQLLSELKLQGVRLWLEDNRLRYRAPEGVMSPELILEIKDQKDEIISFLQEVNSTIVSDLPPLIPVERQNFIPLSFAQKRFWLLHQFEPDSSANNMPVVLRLTGILDVLAWEESIREVVRRHEILRTTYPENEGEPYQRIAPDTDLSLPIIDLRQFSPEQRETEALRLATEIAQMPFDLVEGPMLHVRLLQLKPNEYLFVWCFHCITGDGSSSDIFFQELTAIYAAFSTGQPSPLPDCLIQYADFSQWQREWLQGEVLQSRLEYWKKKLSGNLSAIQLPTDHPRPPVQTYRGDRCPRMFTLDLHRKLLNLSQKSGTTLFMTLLAAFETLLYRYSNQDDILISFTNAGRNQVETERLIGFFSGTLLLRTNFSDNPTFRELMAQVKDEALEAYAHQDLPFEKLVEELRPEQNQSRSPLFQIKFALNPPWTNGRGMDSVHLPKLKIDSLFGYIYHGKTKFDLILVMREQVQGLGAVFDYNADLFNVSTAARMMDHFQMLLESIVANPDQHVLELPLLTSTEQKKISKWNSTESKYFQEVCIHQLFEKQVEHSPNNIAIIAGAHQLTYRELNQKANQFAYYLQELGVKIGTKVGICLPRSVENIIAILGTLKAGGIYVSLMPESHLESSQDVHDLQSEIIITQTELTEKKADHTYISVSLDLKLQIIQKQSKSNLDLNINVNQPAFVWGVGSPTKIEVSHLDTVQSYKDIGFVNLDAEAVLLHHSVLESPISNFEIWGSLLNGTRLVIAPLELLDPECIAQLILQYQITTLWLPTRIFNRIVDTNLENLKSVRHLLVGGNVLSELQVTAVQQELSKCRLIHVYSPANIPGITCFYAVPESLLIDTVIPIGRPTVNTKVFILNSQLQSVPIGVPGEIYVDKACVSSKFYPSNTDELISQHIKENFGKTLGKTGDLARYLPDGNIEWITKLTDLIKIGGWRIEPSRIEAVLNHHKAIQESVVIVRKDLPVEKSLVAYVVVKPGYVALPSDLKIYLKQKLPILMVPSTFVFLNEISLTSMGDVNLALLPKPNQTEDISEQLVQSRDRVEAQLTQIWNQMFNISSIGINDNFFDLGGDSLMAVRLFSKIEEVRGQKLPLSVLLPAPTISQLAELLKQGSMDSAWNPLVLIQSGESSKLPLFCIHGGGFNVLIYRQLAMNLKPDQPVYGLQARGLDGENTSVGDRIEDLALDYIQQIRTVQPFGPYLIAGLSNGGIIALEMAQQLSLQGQEIAFLGMFDTYGPNAAYILPSLARFRSSLCYMFRYSLPRKINNVWKQKKAAKITDVLSKNNAENKQKEADQDKIKLGSWIDQFSQYILEHSPWSFFTPKEVLDGVAGRTSETLKKLEDQYSKTYERYIPKVYQGTIILFRASETPPGYHIEKFLGWDKVAKLGVKEFEIPGHHTSMMKSLILAIKLNECLKEIQNP